MSEIKIKPVATWGPCCKIILIGVWGPRMVHDSGCVNRSDGKLGSTHLLYTTAALDAAREQGRKELQAEVERLRAELAAAQKDAAMFLWLADAEPFSARWQIVRLEWWRGRDGWSDVRGDALRLAIAAAMAQEKRDE